MKYLKIYESSEVLNIDDVIELLIDLDDLVFENVGNNHLKVKSDSKSISLITILDRLDDVMTQFDTFELSSITAFFSERVGTRGWTSEQKFKFLKSCNHTTYDFLMKEYKYQAVATIKDIREESFFYNKRYNELYILFSKKEVIKKRSIIKSIKSFFSSK